MDIKNFKKRFPTSYQLQTEKNGKYTARSDGENIYLYGGTGYLEIVVFHDLEYVSNIKFSDDGSLLCAISGVPELAVYDVADLKLICRIKFNETEQFQEGSFCFSPDNNYIYYVLLLSEYNSVIARVDIRKQSYCILFQHNNYIFESVHYADWKEAIIFYGKDKKTKNAFIFEYGLKNDRYKRKALKAYYNMLFPIPEAQGFIGIINNRLYILKSDYSKIRDFMPVNDSKKELNFFNIITDSEVLNKEFQKDKAEYERMKQKAESDMLDVPIDGDVKCVAVSPNLKYLFVATENVLKTFEYETFKELNTIQFVNISDIEFSYDNEFVLIGTWNYGYVYSIVDLLE